MVTFGGFGFSHVLRTQFLYRMRVLRICSVAVFKVGTVWSFFLFRFCKCRLTLSIELVRKVVLVYSAKFLSLIVVLVFPGVIISCVCEPYSFVFDQCQRFTQIRFSWWTKAEL